MMSSIHRVRYEIHGDMGLASTTHGEVSIHHEPSLCNKGVPTDRTYRPHWPEHAELANKAGHGGGDFWTNFYFANVIRSKTQPYFNVYRATAMAAVSILGWRSCLNNGNNIPIPDFRNKKEREKYRNDDWSPFPEDAKDGQPPVSISGNIKPSAKAIAHAKKIWRSIGYNGQ